MRKLAAVLLCCGLLWTCNKKEDDLLYLETKEAGFHWETVEDCNCPKPPLPCPIRLIPSVIEGLDLAYQWEINEDTIIASRGNIKHALASAQWHDVKLSAYHLDGKLEDKTVRIPSVYIGFEYQNSDCLSLPCPVEFINTSRYPADLDLDFEWDFGNGWKYATNEKTVQYAFENMDIQQVQLHATHEGRIWKTGKEDMLIGAIDFSCQIAGDFSHCVSVPCSIQFINESRNIGSDWSFRWLVNGDSDNLNIDANGNLQHEFITAGMHYVRLQAIHTNGAMHETEKVVKVQEVKADFEMYPDTCTLDAIINECVIRFENTSVGYEPFAFEWIFLHTGRKDTTQVQTPYQGYKRDGVYYVRLNVREDRTRNSKVIDSVTKPVVILRAPLPVNFFRLDSAIVHYTPRNWSAAYDPTSLEMEIEYLNTPNCDISEVEFLRKYQFNGCTIPVDLEEYYEFVLYARRIGSTQREVVGRSRAINFKHHAAIEKVRPNTADRIYISNPDNSFAISIDGFWKE